MTGRLNNEAVHASLEELDDSWFGDADHIHRTFTFDKFAEGMEFVQRLGEVADEQNHHPDIDIRYTNILVDLSTHSENGVTDLDFELARRADQIAADLRT